MIVVEMEELKNVLKDKRKQISADLRDEINKRHIGEMHSKQVVS